MFHVRLTSITSDGLVYKMPQAGFEPTPQYKVAIKKEKNRRKRRIHFSVTKLEF